MSMRHESVAGLSFRTDVRNLGFLPAVEMTKSVVVANVQYRATIAKREQAGEGVVALGEFLANK